MKNDVIDEAAGRHAAEAAIEAVENAASQKIKEALLVAIRRVAENNAVFSSDHVWVEFTHGFPALTVTEPRLLGPLMRRAESLGVCKSTGKTTRSSRPQRHTGSVMVYNSLLCVAEKPEIDALTQAHVRIVELEQEVALLYRLLRKRS